MKLANISQGFLINFNVKLLKLGIKKLCFMNLANAAVLPIYQRTARGRGARLD